MPKQKQRKNREELIQSGLRMYNAMPQYRMKLASGDMTEEDMYIMASNWADRQLEAREKRLAGESEDRHEERLDDLDYRREQETSYRKGFVWESANDESSLEHLLDLEVQIRQIGRELEASKDPGAKNELRKTLSNTVKEHRTLQKDLGIDRVTRSKAEQAKSSVDEWERIKKDAKRKLEQLANEFADEAGKVKTEGELRDRLKYHGAIPFRMVDDILSNHRRVLGLDPTVEKS